MMSRKALMPGVALLASLAVLPGTADANGMKMFHRTGTWASWAGINNQGNPQCVTMTSAVGNATGMVMLKFDTNNRNRLIVNLAKRSWKIPDGASMRVQLQVDNAPARIYDAEGVGDNMVGFAIDLDDSDPVTGEPAMQLLFNLLMSGQTLTATFPDGNERPWQASLNGSAVELGQFGTCIQTVKSAANPTQPFSPGKTSSIDEPQPGTWYSPHSQDAGAVTYDASWYKANGWSGEYPNGFTMTNDVTLNIRDDVNINSPKTVSCRLKKGATYHRGIVSA